MALILDTGVVFAALDRSDDAHGACRRLVEDAGEPLIIPAPVLVEVDYLVHARLHAGVLLSVLDDIDASAFEVAELSRDDYRRIRELCDQYADSDIGLVDAAVLAVVERLREPKLATLDRTHFSLLRPRHVAALQLLPE